MFTNSLSLYDNKKATNSKSARTSAEEKRLLLKSLLAIEDELECEEEAYEENIEEVKEVREEQGQQI